MTTDARELDLYAENTFELYEQFKAIIRNLTRKINVGKYDPARAPKMWRYWYDRAAKMYAQEFGSPGWNFPVSVRQECAEARAIEEYEKITNGEYCTLS